MEKSESIKEIALSLSLFNSEITKIEKDGVNPFHNKNYATLDQIIDVIRPLLSKHGLSILQMPGGSSDETSIRTMLIHTSGEWIISDPFGLKPVKNDPQAVGSAITYGRRYSLNAFLSLNTGEDDDGNEASGKSQRTNNTQQPPTVPEMPQNRPTTPPDTNTQGTSGKASDKQLNAIKAIAKSKGKTDEYLNEQAMKHFGKPLAEFSRDEASKFIDALQKV